MPQLSAHLEKVGNTVHFQAPVLSTVRTLGATNITREIGKLVKPKGHRGHVPCGGAFAPIC